MSCRMSLLVAV